MKNAKAFVMVIITLLALTSMLCLHGAVPFLATPTLGQAVWTAGFAQSFLNDSIFSIYARNFGAPHPAAIAFGLAGAWPTAVFMKLGLHPADAYSAMVAFWLTVAFFSAYKIGRIFQATPLFSLLGAMLWLSMPIVWAHAGYSMVSTGIALLPFYFFVALKLFLPVGNSKTSLAVVKKTLLYIVACVISVFMDGYSFMMFATGATILAAWMFTIFPEHRRQLLFHGFPTHVFGFALAYVLYALYIGKPTFTPAPLDFFRGWGVDLTFLVAPTRGMHWIPDLLGWSVHRSSAKFFGDASVWKTTFCLPLILAGCWAWLKAKERRNLTVGFLLIAMFGFYMALGPSLKIHSIKPPGQNLGPLMPAEYAIAPTGSAFISKHLPGFWNMRASYRWLALFIVGCWLSTVSALSQSKRSVSISTAVLVIFVIIFNLPHISAKWNSDVNHRKMFFQIDTDLLSGMEKIVHKGERVAFLPYRNDFLVNYLAAELDIVTYNIGGDKNLVEARKHWPKTMQQFHMGTVDKGFSERVLLLLARNEADVIILPYIDMLRAAHRWPYPIKYKEMLRPVVEGLVASGFIHTKENKYYAAVRLKPEMLAKARNGQLEQEVLKILHAYSLGEHISFAKGGEGIRYAVSGWSHPEPWGTWLDGDEAIIVLKLASEPKQDLVLALEGHAFVTAKHPHQEVDLKVNGHPLETLSYDFPSRNEIRTVPVPKAFIEDRLVRLEFKFKDAISPNELGLSQGPRRLGLGLVSLMLQEKEALSKCPPSRCLKASGFDSKTPHQVGKLEGKSLVSDGRRGFLLYGPYVSLQAGKYRLKVYGQTGSADSGWVDVVSDKGKIQHAKFPIAQGSGTLVQGEVNLKSPVSDLEVRVYVDKDAKIRIEGYELGPASKVKRL